MYIMGMQFSGPAPVPEVSEELKQFLLDALMGLALVLIALCSVFHGFLIGIRVGRKLEQRDMELAVKEDMLGRYKMLEQEAEGNTGDEK